MVISVHHALTNKQRKKENKIGKAIEEVNQQKMLSASEIQHEVISQFKPKLLNHEHNKYTKVKSRK